MSLFTLHGLYYTVALKQIDAIIKKYTFIKMIFARDFQLHAGMGVAQY